LEKDFNEIAEKEMHQSSSHEEVQRMQKKKALTQKILSKSSSENQTLAENLVAGQTVDLFFKVQF
jgi:hypothetical protein